MGVPVVVLRYDKRDMGHVSKYVTEVHRIPFPDNDPQQVLQTLRWMSARHPGALLMSASDPAIALLAQHQYKLAELGFTVATSSEKAAMTFLDKTATYALARAVGVDIPITVTLDTEDDIARYAEVAAFPAVLKPALSHRYQLAFGRKWTRVDNLDAAVREFALARAAGITVNLQEFIPGDELCGANYNSYFCLGDAQVEFTARKIRNSPPETGSPCAAVSQHIPEVIEPGRRLLAAADFRGFSCIEFKRDSRDGVYKLIEVNGRHNLSGMLALRCGINFPWIHYQHLMLGRLPHHVDFEKGVHWVDITRDMKTLRYYRQVPGYSAVRFAQPYLSRHVFAVLSGRDPKPAIARARDTLRVITTGHRIGNFFPPQEAASPGTTTW